ncbi:MULTISPECIES: aspartate/glutamate racemase family protein [unclassified Herbaspirillum]|uniref:aspartate/glutamate racemase family protein n=1 Tax=unclassified Herbaspirillum TaxID=2624150 RepID=UPI0011549AFD|nr:MULTISPECIES: aspartate/glutamate racemase family protein [unclassified Herbaspirillum]MBB5392722.1 Asp/Glu/hydantoin racemase [Herbaspirillum sp. SJZ102]TQJ99106.1 Asp/Glu/hydantoin racemase [Herbaspirillum sp. SJZ130]TQK04119.1 Asp/Glu/hydantoin racemase [Herbaspirillum sp. SJZ106]
MRHILLINPNSSAATTEMMVAIAAAELPPGFSVSGVSARSGPGMIVNSAELEAAAPEVERNWQEFGRQSAGVIVSAFGDPGIERVRAAGKTPVAGICEASMLEAAQGGRRFGVATVTPELAGAIAAKAQQLGLGGLYTGIRLTAGDPRALAADPQALEQALAQSVRECVELDGAQAVVIGGGPLGQAAIALARRFTVPVIAPIPAAVRDLLRQLNLVDAAAAA